MRYRYLFFIPLLILLAVPAWGGSPTNKIDPRLTPALQKETGPSPAQESQRRFKASSGSQEGFVGTIIRFKGDLDGITRLGGRIRSVIGDIATVDLPRSAIVAVSKLPNVVYIEAPRPLGPRLDVSVPATGADTLRSGTPPHWTGGTGKGVIVGIVDTGIDLNHHNFRDASGQTRILSLWDQAASGTPPAGFGYGHECTKAVIDAGGCPEIDGDGHGTHVAGIAAGNGSATGNGEAAFRYVGMAPEADLVVVGPIGDSLEVLDGIAYIQGKAAAVGKPSVVNLSLGSHLGPHDGTSNFERGLDNASGIGKLIVAGAGNDGNRNDLDENIHASGTVAAGGTTTVAFDVLNAEVELDLWYAGADRMKISLTNGTCTTREVLPEEPFFFEDSGCGSIAITPSGVNRLNGDREIVIALGSGSSPLAMGRWSFTLSRSGTGNGRFDVWSTFQSVSFASHIDRSMTLIDTATAEKTIAVGSYVTKTRWQSMAGTRMNIFGTPGDISSFSSFGPRRPCSDVAQCPSVQKPEITAPGEYILSALSAQANEPPENIDPDGVHLALQGTSMAAPHVTGAVALLLQTHPRLTPEEVKRLLFDNTKPPNAFTGTLPNDTWGHGVLDVSALGTFIVPEATCDGRDDDGDGVIDDGFPDTDRDGTADCVDTDDDGDGTADGADNCPLTPNANQTDTDRDSTGDTCDADDDGDGIADRSDAFPLDRTESVDTDRDGIGNNADPDDDGDKIADATDNCPLTANANQADANDDGTGDLCDPNSHGDDDGDGIINMLDECPLLAAPHLIVGTAGNDTLIGTPGPDLIRGLGGNDKIIGGGGNDCLVGGSGKDTIFGGDGNDILLGGKGNDRMRGDAGNDRLEGGAGKDQLRGGRGDDRLDGGAQRDRCLGGGGTDTATQCERASSVP